MVARPVNTCTPWVSRYSQAGPAGQGNHGMGVWAAWESSPVTKQTVNATPRAIPRMVAGRS